MKLAYAAAMAALTALLCLGTPAQAKCGDSGTCNHGRIYVKSTKALTASRATTSRSTRAIAAKHRKTAQIHHVSRTKSVRSARLHRAKAAPVRMARFHKVSRVRMAMIIPASGGVAAQSSPADRHSGSSAAVVDMISTMAPQYGVPTWFALRIAKIESGYNPRLRGQAGEYGVFQIKCPTARGLGFEGDCSGLFDARTNVRWGLQHLSAALKSSGGNLQLAASKHNGGLGRKTIIQRYVNLVF